MSGMPSFIKHPIDALKALMKHKEEEHHQSKSEAVKDLINETIAEVDRELFKHFCHEDLRKLLKLNAAEVLRDQTVEDILDHMDRALTKGNVTDHEKDFCADVLVKMFTASGDNKVLFDRIEVHIGNEHFIQDLVSHNGELRKIVDAL